MSKLLRRVLFVIRASRSGRGEDLDRVMGAMEEGARFKGAAGVMLLAIAKDGGRCDLFMRSGRPMLTDELLGEAYARKITAYVRLTMRDDPFRVEDGK